MQRMQYCDLEVPHFLIIDGKLVDASYGNDMLVDLLIDGDTDGGWCIDAIHVHARKVGDGMLRLGDATFELPPSHELYKPLHDWIVARCSDCITDRWETYIAESSQLRADAWREARYS